MHDHGGWVGGGIPMTDSLTALAGRLVANGIRFRYLRAAGNVSKPWAVSLEVTHRCIAKCLMCNIWQIPRDTPFLSADQWLQLLSRDLFTDLVELDITGGEPFLRKDLADLLIAVCQHKETHLPALKSIAVTTNGILTEPVLKGTKKVLIEAQHKDTDLVVVCAMDAVGELHDTVRGYSGGWIRLNRTIQGLIRLREKFPNLIVGLKSTILPMTVGHLDAIVRYAKKYGLFTIVSPCIITQGRYLNDDRAEALSFDRQQIDEMTRFFRKKATQWSFHDQCLVSYFESGRMKKPCTCGFNYFFIRSQGDLMPCPMIDASLGNVIEEPIETLLASEKGRRIRRRIGRFPECSHCTEPGLERYSLPFEGWTYLSLLPRMGKRRFEHMHVHLGLDKYFM